MEKTITFLGTSSMVPTKKRNVQSIHVKLDATNILIDCGEGTQRQMNIAGINRNKLDAILITHWHADHTSGIMGLLQTIGHVEFEKPLKIIGPSKTTEFLTHILQSCYFSIKPNIEIIELEETNNPEQITSIGNIDISYMTLDHGVPCNGYTLTEKTTTKIDIEKLSKYGLTRGPKIGKIQRGQKVEHEGKTLDPKDFTFLKKGKKISIIMDTKYNPRLKKIAHNADILICESTYDNSNKDKAKEYNHMTSSQAAKIAKDANAGELYLTHFSQRYRNTKTIESEAKEIFSKVKCAKDFQKVNLK